MFRIICGECIITAKGFRFRKKACLVFVPLILALVSTNAFGFMSPKYAPEVKAAVLKYSAFYRQMDAEGIASVYSPNGDAVVIGAGKDQDSIDSKGVISAYEKEFSFYKKIRSLDLKINSMSSLGHVCWISADVFGDVVLSNGSKSIISGRFTAVLRKFGNKWLFIQSHFSIPADGPKRIK